MTLIPGYIQRVPADAAKADAPVSTGEAWMTQHNLYHCLTQCPQAYVNWAGLVADPDSSLVVGVVADFTTQFAFPFRATWWDSRHPAGFRLMVWARTTAVIATVHVEARVVSDIGPPGNDTAPVLLNAGGANIPGASATKIIDASASFVGTAGDFQTFTGVENSQAVPLEIFLGRLELAITSTVDEPETFIEICAVSLWGFS